MSKHTAAPWYVEELPYADAKAAYIKAKSSGQNICTVHRTDKWGTEQVDTERAANARLIAAAPDLLEACKKATSCASIPDYVMDVLRAAIKKAEG